MIRWIIKLMMMFLLLGMFTEVGQAGESAESLSTSALKECDLGRRAKERDVRMAHFEKGQALAEKAVKLNESHADAHFAIFCNYGEKLRIDGEGLVSVIGFPKAVEELDRTLELDPNHIDALSSKGTVLIKLPWVFGGDQEKGEHLLRQVIQRAPRAVNARLTLALTCANRGEYEEAYQLTKVAMKLAKEGDRQDLIPEAKAMLAKIKEADPGIAQTASR